MALHDQPGSHNNVATDPADLDREQTALSVLIKAAAVRQIRFQQFVIAKMADALFFQPTVASEILPHALAAAGIGEVGAGMRIHLREKGLVPDVIEMSIKVAT